MNLGGLTATYMGLKHSEVFGNVLCQSGSFWYKSTKSDEKKECQVELERRSSELDCWMSEQIKSSPKLPLKFYMNIGVLENKQRIAAVFFLPLLLIFISLTKKGQTFINFLKCLAFMTFSIILYIII